MIDDVTRFELRDAIMAAMRVLAPRDREVLIARHGLDGEGGQTQDELSRRFGVTRCRIGQIEARARRRLRYSPELREFWAA